MDEFGRSNSGKEKALADWRFRPSGMMKNRGDTAPDTAWIVQASQRDMEFVVQALQRELNSRPHKSTSPPQSNPNNSSDVASSTVSNSDSGSPPPPPPRSVASSTVSNSDSGSPPPPPPRSAAPAPSLPQKITGKRRSRGATKTPTTFVAADPGNFRDMVQKVTGIPRIPRSAAAAGGGGGSGGGTVLKPQPKRPCRSANVAALSMLESSSLPHNNPYPYPYVGFAGGAVSGLFGSGAVTVTPPSHNIPFYNPGLTAGSLGVTSSSPGLSGYYDNFFLQNELFGKSETREASFGDPRWLSHQNDSHE